MAPYEHKSGLPRAYDRHTQRPAFTAVVFQEADPNNGAFLQGADLNEMQSILNTKLQRVARMTARDGDRVDGGEITVKPAQSKIILQQGRVYLKGDVREVPYAELTGVPMAGEVVVGVRLVQGVDTYLSDPALLGLHAGSDAEGEVTAARERDTVAWGFSGDSGSGALHAVYLMIDGVVIDQDLPSSVSGINGAIAAYDRGAHGHYVVRGNAVSAAGKRATAQVFHISAGEANIQGFKRVHYEDFRVTVAEEPDVELIEAESKTFDDGGTGTYSVNVNHRPIAVVETVTVEKQRTDTITRGGTTGGTDALPRTSVLSVVEVKQGGTTYTESVDFTLGADAINWAPGGAEPAPGSTYTVKYRYLDSVANGSGYTHDDNSITVMGGVTGGQILFRYTYKLPRVDVIGLNAQGIPVYIKGESDDVEPLPPQVPNSVLKLAEVTNTWRGKPKVKQAGIRSITFEEQKRLFELLLDVQYIASLERLRSGLDSREPVLKKGTFVDPFLDDTLRDAGVSQTAAVGNGICQLAIDPTFTRMSGTRPVMLDYTHEIVVKQTQYSECMKINPFQVFDPEPAELELTPSQDFWTEFDTIWLSPVTNIFGNGNHTRTETEVEEVEERTQLIEFLREIPINFTVRGLVENEALEELTFDGIDVLPGGLPLANAEGVITGTFNIPADVKAGTKRVRAKSNFDRKASAIFAGQGVIEIDVMRRTTNVHRWSDPPIVTVPTFLEGGNDGGRDPLAQTIMLSEGRFISGIDLRFCAKGNAGNGVTVQLVRVRDGTPTSDVLSQAFVDMGPVVLDVMTRVLLNEPVWVPGGVEVAFVLKTDDAIHSVAVARMGSIDTGTLEPISAQPYTVGVLQISSNARTWTPVQDADLCMRVLACKFAPQTKVHNFGPISVSQMSDLIIRATVELPTEDANFYFELERSNGKVIRLRPHQARRFTQFITETVQLRAVLKGNDKVSPVMYPGVLFVKGTLRTNGTYISVAMRAVDAIQVTNYLKALLPGGSTAQVAISVDEGAFSNMTLESTDQLNDGWIEPKRTKTLSGATTIRLRLTLTGNPGARPAVTDFMALTL